MGIVRASAVVLAALVVLSAGVLAGGLDGLGVGPQGVGMSGAFRAIADDWSAAFYNPAGYANVYDNQLGGSVSLIHFRNEITPEFRWAGEFESGMVNDVAGYNKHEVLSIPSAGFIVRLPVWGEMVFGLSAYEPFDYNTTWKLYEQPAAYNEDLRPPTNQFTNNLDVVAFQITAAREFSEDKLSLGLGLALLRADLLHNNVYFRNNPYLAIDPDWKDADRPYDKIVHWSQDDGYGFGFGIRGGLLYKLSERMNVGASFFYPSKITVSGNSAVEYYMPHVHFTDQDGDDPLGVEALLKSGTKVVDSADFDCEITMPASIGGGIAYQAGEKLLLSLDVEYTFWSQFDGYFFEYSNHKLTANPQFQAAATSPEVYGFLTSDLSKSVDWNDAAAFMAGARYDWSEGLTLLGGVSIDQSPAADNEYFSTHFMDLGTKVGLSGGFIAHIQQWDIGLTTSYVGQPDADDVMLVDIDGDGSVDTFAGDYKAASYNTSLMFNYRF